MTMKRVYPTSAAIAAVMLHPGQPKPLDMVKGGLWPDDQFTSRRLQEGAITVIKPSTAPEPQRGEKARRKR